MTKLIIIFCKSHMWYIYSAISLPIYSSGVDANYSCNNITHLERKTRPKYLTSVIRTDRETLNFVRLCRIRLSHLCVAIQQVSHLVEH